MLLKAGPFNPWSWSREEKSEMRYKLTLIACGSHFLSSLFYCETGGTQGAEERAK